MLDIVPEKMIRMQTDPWVNKKGVALVENVETVPCRVERRSELRNKVYALDDVIERNNLRARLTMTLRIGDNVHLRRRVDCPERAKPLNIRQARWDR